jgi:CDP-diacylglycerol pyrophosphatase
MIFRHVSPRLGFLVAMAVAATPALADGPDGSHVRDKLRDITHTQCVPHWLKAKDPAPCLRVTLISPEPLRGFCVLPDRKGGAHLLLIPLEAVSGIESADARNARGPNYFQEAWESRAEVAKLAGHVVPPEVIGLAINSKYTRSQDQLHIHMACIGPSVHEQLVASADTIGTDWSPIVIRGTRYHALRVMGTDLGDANPFTLLSERLPGARGSMDAYTMLVAGMSFKEGPGFVVLAAKFAPGSELLLDPTCSLAR